MRTPIRTALAAMLLALGAGIAPAAEPAGGPADEATAVVSTEVAPIGAPAAIDWRRAVELNSAHAPAVLEPGSFELPGITFMQPGDPGYDAWRADMDAARGKRRRGMILTAGGFLGAPLVGGLVAGGSAAAGSETGVGVGGLIYLAGIGVGIWGVFEWINGHSDMGDLRLDGERAGYVSVAPVRGGAVATVALSF